MSADDIRATSARRAAACAPWVRTRLRTAPGAAGALAVLVLVTAFLAAAFPRAVDTYETNGLQHAFRSADPRNTVMELTTPPSWSGVSIEAAESAVRGAALSRIHGELIDRLPASVRADAHQSSYGVRTLTAQPATETWLPRPYGLDPEFTYATTSDLPGHSTLSSGSWPRTDGEVTLGTRQVEAVVTENTAAALHFKVGSVIAVPTETGQPLTVRISGIIMPRQPKGSYWSVDPLMRDASLVRDPASKTPVFYWRAALLLSPDAGPALLSTTGGPELYWRLAPDGSRLTSLDVEGARSAIASLEDGPQLLEFRSIAGPEATMTTQLDDVLIGYEEIRDAIRPVVTVAALGIGAVAVVVLLMTGGLITGRRRGELALLRSRGASLPGIGRRLLAESAVTGLLPAALGLLLAVLIADGPRLWPSLAGAAGVALLVCVVQPVRATLAHRTPNPAGGRDDLMTARPSRRRTVTELTLLVLATGAVAALRRRGTGAAGGTDALVSAAPVLVGLIAALVLVRLYPLPMRLAARPVARLRGAIGFLSLARAGRSTANSTLPLLALLIALTTAAFGGSVLAGVAQARDSAALAVTGADARISGQGETTPMTDRLVRAVRETDGVEDVAAVRIEYGVRLPGGAPDAGGLGSAGGPDAGGAAAVATLIGVDPQAYGRLARATGLDTFPSGLLKATGPAATDTDGTDGDMGDAEPSPDRVLPVIASPSVAEQLGDRPRELSTLSGQFKVKVVAVLSRTSALDTPDFLVVNTASLTQGGATTLLVTGKTLDAGALRTAVRETGKGFGMQLRSEEREAFVDTPMQTGAERIYGAAIAAGAGYALLTVMLSLLQSAPERKALLARLRTMGLTTRQGRRLLALEAMPQALLAAAGGLLVGWATIALLAPGVDLAALALAGGPDDVTYTASLRADPWSLALPALGVLLLTGAVAGVQAWWASRRGSITELRAGDPQ